MNINSINFKSNQIIKTKTNKEEKAALNQQNQSQAHNVLNAGNPLVVSALKAQNINVTRFKEIETFDIPGINTKGKLYLLNNGQKVIVVPKEGPTTVKSYVKVGSFNEPDNIRGISHYIEHNLFNGSQKLAPGEFVKKISDIGSSYNASTNFCMTDYYIESPLHNGEDFKNIVTMHADMLQHPLFTQKMLDKEKGPVISEIQMYQDSPYNLAQNTMLKKLFNIKSESPDLIAGTVKSVGSLTQKDVFDYYNKWYSPENITTVIVGDIDANKAINTVADSFGVKPLQVPKSMDEYVSNFSKHYEKLDTNINSPKRTDMFSPLVNSTTLELGFIGPKNNDVKESLKAEALMTALTGYDNSRLTIKLKEFSTEAISSVSVVSPNFEDPQVVQLDTLFRPGEEKKVIKAIYEVLNSLKNSNINDTELQIIKNKLKDNINVSSEYSMIIADKIGDAIVNRGDLKAYTEKLNLIDQLTVNDIKDAANKYLDTNKVSMVLLHPETERNRIQKEANESVNVLKTDNSKQISFTGTKNPINSQNISEYRLNNNSHLVINESPSSTRLSLSYLLKTDNIPQYKPGVPEILSEIFNNGSSHYLKEQISDVLDVNNVKISGAAGNNSIAFGLECPPENVELATQALQEILFSPNLNEKIFQDIKSGLKLKFMSQQKNPAVKAVETMYGNHPYGNSSEKILNNLDNITLQDVKNFYNEVISNSQCRIIATAPFEEKQGLKATLFQSLQNGFPIMKPTHISTNIDIPKINKNKLVTVADNRQQAHIMQMFSIKESGNIKDRAAIHLMNAILGETSQSRLFMDLREKQLLAYMVKSKYTTDGNVGEIGLEIKTTTDDAKSNNGVPLYENLKKSLEGFKYHILKMQNEPVSDDELKSAKLALKSKIIFGCESSAGKTELIQGGYNTPYGKDYVSELIKAIDNITAKDIQNAAKLYLGQPSVTSIVASPDTIKNQQPYLQSLGDVLNY